MILCTFAVEMRNKLLIMAFALGMCYSAKGQEKAELTLGTDVVSEYVWRGLQLGSASFQPTLGVSWKGLSLTAWGSVGFVDRNDAREIDLIGAYTTGSLSVGIIDYWCTDPCPQYFRYKAHETSHVFEAFVGYDFGVLSLSWQTNFAGADGRNKSGHRAYSSYFELAAPFHFVTCNWQASLGIVPWATDYYEASNFTVTNISLKATKEIRFTDKFGLDVFAQLTANPEARNAHFVAGLSWKLRNGNN